MSKRKQLTLPLYPSKDSYTALLKSGFEIDVDGEQKIITVSVNSLLQHYRHFAVDRHELILKGLSFLPEITEAFISYLAIKDGTFQTLAGHEKWQVAIGRFLQRKIPEKLLGLGLLSNKKLKQRVEHDKQEADLRAYVHEAVNHNIKVLRQSAEKKARELAAGMGGPEQLAFLEMERQLVSLVSEQVAAEVLPGLLADLDERISRLIKSRTEKGEQLSIWHFL